MFTKVRPFQKQYYKYAHAKDYGDLFATNRRYLEDVTPDGVFEWSLESLTSAYGAFSKERCTSVEINPAIRIFRCPTPNVTQIQYMFWAMPTLEYIEMNFDKVTSNFGWYVADGCVKLKRWPDNMYTSTYNIDQGFKGTLRGTSTFDNESQQYVMQYNDFINSVKYGGCAFNGADGNTINNVIMNDLYTFENLLTTTTMFKGVNLAKVSKNLNLKSLTTVNGIFEGNNIYRFDSKEGLPNLATGSGMFYARSLTSSIDSYAPMSHFCPGTDFGLPSLSAGSNMFANCYLKRESIVKILSSLPIWNDGKSHVLTMGCHIDSKLEAETEGTELYNLIADVTAKPSYDTEGNHIRGKGWTLTFQWNGVLSGNEPETIELVDLPDGYKQLAYLNDSFNSTIRPSILRCIDTNYIPTSNTGIYVKAKQTSSTSNRYPAANGTTDNSFSAPIWPKNTSEKAKVLWNTAKQWDVVGTGEYYEGYTNWLNSGTSDIILPDGTTHSLQLGELTSDLPNAPIYIFAQNDNGKSVNPFLGRIYRVKISEGEEIVRDFVPALDPENKPCMYELFEGKAYYTGCDFIIYDTHFDFIAPSQIGLEPQVASYSLRRTVEPIYAKVVDDTYGMYKRKNGSRCNIEHVNLILGGDWEEMGYEICYSIEEIEEKYNLHKLTPEEAAKLIPKS